MPRCWSAIAVMAVTAVVTAAPASAAPRAGAWGIGDPYCLLFGNGGYGVQHYSIDVGYGVDTGWLTGTTKITATATVDLSQFNLDFG